MLDRLREAGFDVATRNHAQAILAADFADETAELIDALLTMRLDVREIITSGGGEAPSTQRLRRQLAAMGWRKHNFRIETLLDGRKLGEGTTHEIDHVRQAPNGLLALEIEWNNKDPFFDRDLENFQRLHAQSVISIGIIVTRGASLQRALARIVHDFLAAARVEQPEDLLMHGVKKRTDRQSGLVDKAVRQGTPFPEAFSRLFVADKFGMATTHWAKLMERVARGVGNPCPLLLVGLPDGIVQPYSAASDEL
ncbi:BglII/BstYI family type II restriction endonuclease [Frigidibacter oleivorans]|uniref:BglII/BstYI family type II restriction endonuclease n=1 Tax=Frigidibacter oleivorans TaxID=2487129 RepID=UPI000F8D11D2|nr:BglII/BstYI family type II restriction endonuclease [Frigidibacter oleivorans]